MEPGVTRATHPEAEKVNNRRGHQVVVWGDITLIWGGFNYDRQLPKRLDPAIIVCHQDGIWTERTTIGHIPPIFDGIAEVVNDHLYVACGFNNITKSTQLTRAARFAFPTLS